MDKPTTWTSLIPTPEDLIESGGVVPNYQPGVFVFSSPLPDGWRRLRNTDEDFFRWPGDSKPEGFGEIGLGMVCWYAKRRGPIAFDAAVELAGHWLKDWPGTVNFEDLRDWLVASFFTIAGGHQPPLVDGDTYRLLDKDTNLDAVRLDENVVAQCIEKAASSRIHHDALSKAGVLLLRNGQLLGDALSRWVAADYEGSLPRCRERPKGKNALRDRAIVATIKRLEAEGMNATRNATSSRLISACDAIASATNGRVTYEAAVSVWKNRAR